MLKFSILCEDKFYLRCLLICLEVLAELLLY